MKDNVITADEHAILKTLQLKLEISDAEHEQIMGDLLDETLR